MSPNQIRGDCRWRRLPGTYPIGLSSWNFFELQLMATEDLFRIHIDFMIDLRHPLAVLARQLPWDRTAVRIVLPALGGLGTPCSPPVLRRGGGREILQARAPATPPSPPSAPRMLCKWRHGAHARLFPTGSGRAAGAPLVLQRPCRSATCRRIAARSGGGRASPHPPCRRPRPTLHPALRPLPVTRAPRPRCRSSS